MRNVETMTLEGGHGDFQDMIKTQQDGFREQAVKNEAVPEKNREEIEAGEKMSKDSIRVFARASVGIEAIEGGLIDMTPDLVEECIGLLSKDISEDALEHAEKFGNMLLENDKENESGKKLLERIEAVSEEQKEMNKE
jgi:hypothetical protein